MPEQCIEVLADVVIARRRAKRLRILLVMRERACRDLLQLVAMQRHCGFFPNPKALLGRGLVPRSAQNFAWELSGHLELETVNCNAPWAITTKEDEICMHAACPCS